MKFEVKFHDAKGAKVNPFPLTIDSDVFAPLMVTEYLIDGKSVFPEDWFRLRMVQEVASIRIWIERFLIR